MTSAVLMMVLGKEITILMQLQKHATETSMAMLYY